MRDQRRQHKFAEKAHAIFLISSEPFEMAQIEKESAHTAIHPFCKFNRVALPDVSARLSIGDNSRHEANKRPFAVREVFGHKKQTSG